MKSILAASFSVLLLFSCTEKTQVNLVRGQLFDNCTSPLGNVEIALKANEGRSFNNPIILGSAVTEENGAFSFTYELEEEDEGTGNLILIKKSGYKNLLTGIELNESINYGFYNQDTSNLVINLLGNRTYMPTDTLFFGFNVSGQEFFVTPPSNGMLANFEFSLTRAVNYMGKPQIYYGIGKRDFNSAKNITGVSGNMNNIDLVINPCLNSDTTAIVLD